MLPKQGGEQMGQRTHLSQLDIQKLNKLYHCGIHLQLCSHDLQASHDTNKTTGGQFQNTHVDTTQCQFNNKTKTYFFFQMSGRKVCELLG